MYIKALFHGANKKRSHEMLKTQKMLFSRGKHHWLGDGAYLFEEDFYAFKWIRDMFEECHHRFPSDKKELLQYYSILQVDVTVPEDRIFDLMKAEHKILYDRVYSYLEAKKSIEGIAEGTVINYMFNELPGYEEKFDVVRALFTVNRGRYKHIQHKTRLGFMPQEQVCIRNNNVVQTIEKYDFSERYDQFNLLLKDYYFEENISKEESYSKIRKFGYYQK